MGYYTRFELVVHEGTADLDAVHVALDKAMDYPHDESPFEVDGDRIISSDSIKWYDHDEDCAEMSKHFPGAVFMLHGMGEETGDLWEAYYKDGFCQICRVTPVYPPYDPTKLKTVRQAQSEDQGRP